jgi:hypothetical protein
MRLKDNKKDMTDNNVNNMLFLKVKNVRISNIDIWNEQYIDTYRLIASNYLINNIYNEINR